MLLAATNDISYENTAGRCFDVFFARPWYDSETPGAGFTSWRVGFCRRNRHELGFAWDVVRVVVRWGFVCVVAPVVLMGVCAVKKLMMDNDDDLVRKIEALNTKTLWTKERIELVKHIPAMPRYIRLSEDLIFVCGPQGGFETVANDVVGAIARPRELVKMFA